MKLALAPAMQDANATRVIDAVEAGGADAVRFVGGCVRDALLQRPIKDIDLGTTALPEIVIARAEAAGLKAVPTGIEHGTVTVISNHVPVRRRLHDRLARGCVAPRPDDECAEPVPGRRAA